MKIRIGDWGFGNREFELRIIIGDQDWGLGIRDSGSGLGIGDGGLGFEIGDRIRNQDWGFLIVNWLLVLGWVIRIGDWRIEIGIRERYLGSGLAT